MCIKQDDKNIFSTPIQSHPHSVQYMAPGNKDIKD